MATFLLVVVVIGGARTDQPAPEVTKLGVGGHGQQSPGQKSFDDLLGVFDGHSITLIRGGRVPVLRAGRSARIPSR